MKKTALILVTFLLFVGTLSAQKGQLLYFKANLPCCQAAACDALQNEVQSIIDKNFKKTEVILKVVSLDAESNNALVDKHKAKSQTLVLVLKDKRKAPIDLSDILRAYLRNNDKAQLQTAIVARIKQHLK